MPSAGNKYAAPINVCTLSTFGNSSYPVSDFSDQKGSLPGQTRPGRRMMHTTATLHNLTTNCHISNPNPTTVDF